MATAEQPNPASGSWVEQEPGNAELDGATDNSHADQDVDGVRPSGAVEVATAAKGDTYNDKPQIKPNKVYIGGLPENTRPEDLQNCFGKIGNIVNIELKVGYGFVEFDSREAADESVAKYNEGFFMGNKIKVEISRGGSRNKHAGEPGACFRCGMMGHWARECPAYPAAALQPRRPLEPPLTDRIQRDYVPRDYGRIEYPPRDYRRPPSPPRDYRGYPPPPVRRDYDDYYRRAPVMPDRERYGPPPMDMRDAAYRSMPPAIPYDRYDRRDRYAAPVAPIPVGRPRTPPRYREDLERAALPPRDYVDHRPRPASPPRYDYPPRGGAPPDAAIRRRSESPLPRSGGPYDAGYPAPSAGYPSYSSRPRDWPVPPRRDVPDVAGAYRR
ncbi:hypothetical protein FISHEDRAFT_64320 [Fistulina hepatica ATCC 64428]|uniref:RNA-binding domain-containing protein n=1 Tax=Fistulina hepatica ATCC 64428 TaxID=1128425 RepID=A0A0D7AJ50_9AGAR|nr:hypothetical protein FISHEDRAFT_64320 [Fistulina hepatica ATCC 64428]